MEDQTPKTDASPSQPQPSSVRGVMDIQPPRSQAPSSPIPVMRPQQTQVNTLSTDPLQDSGNTAPPAPQVVEGPPSPRAETPRPGLSQELLAQAESETSGVNHSGHSPDTKNPLLAAHASHKSRRPIAAIAIAVVIAIALASVAAYAYMKSQKDKDHAATPDTTHQEHTEDAMAAQSATTQEVEDAAKELDSTINASDESKEIPESGLSEGSIGL